MLFEATDGTGHFALPGALELLRVHAEGYLPRFVPAASLPPRLALERAAALTVRLVDRATGQSVPKGRLTLPYASGEEGPFPSNALGVRLKRIAPAEVRLVGSAEGYRPSAPKAVKLEVGVETKAVLELEREPAPAQKAD